MKHDDRRIAKVEPREPVITGLTLEDQALDVEQLWQQAFGVQDRVSAIESKRRQQRIAFSGDRPVAIAYVSDIHIGNSGTDYRQARADAEIIRDTPGMYTIYHGDGTDNWIMGKLQGLQRGQAVPFDGEVALHKNYLEILHTKLIAVVPGNHDLWTKKLAGLDYMTDLLRDTQILYHPHQVVFDLAVGQASWRHVVRHKFRGSSVFNPTHGQEVTWGRGDVDYDVAVAGHTHIATLFRPFYAHQKMRLAILTGTYKNIREDYGEELGMPRPQGSGCGAVIYYPDGRISPQYDLQTAADFLQYLGQL